MTSWSLFMLVTSGLFATGTVIAAARMPLWRRMPLTQFKPGFSKTIFVADKVQPMLLLLAAVSTMGFAFQVDVMSGTVALASAGGLVVIGIASGAVLVPLQRRIIGFEEGAEVTEALRLRWFRGHLGRCALAVTSFALAVVATSV